MPTRDLRDIPDLELVWRERAARVRRSRSRTSPAGMTRPPRDPDERAFLEGRGERGPFREVSPRRSAELTRGEPETQ